MIVTRRRPSTSKPRGAPEHRLQVQVKQYLTYCLPPEVEWTANAAGVHVTQNTANKMKAAGVRRGWADLQFLFPDGVTRYIELKSKDGSLRPEQREFAQRCRPHNIFAVCRSLDEVEVALRGWGAALRSHPFNDPAVNSSAVLL